MSIKESAGKGLDRAARALRLPGDWRTFQSAAAGCLVGFVLAGVVFAALGSGTLSSILTPSTPMIRQQDAAVTPDTAATATPDVTATPPVKALVAPAPSAPAAGGQDKPAQPKNSSSILWSDVGGPNELEQWIGDDGGGIFNSGTGSVKPADGVTHDGHPAIALSITGADGQEQAARIFRWKENPVQAYYGVWLYFLKAYHPASWWNVFQFKSKPDMEADANDPMWVLNIGNLPNGDMTFYLWDAINEKSYDHQLVKTAKSVPAGCWTHVEAFYLRSTEKEGQITIWQDGIKIFDIKNVQTAIADNVQWGLANYTDDVTPSDPTIYASQATMSTSRLGPGNGSRCK